MRISMKHFFPDMLRVAIWASALALPAVSGAATAVVFSNFGPGLTYNTSTGNAVGNAFDGNTYAEADTFKTTGNGTLTSLQLALSCAFACPDTFTISLTQNSAGHPGAVLESFTYAGSSLGAFGSNNAPVTLTSLLHPLLSGGTQYWVEVQADLNDSIAWNFNSTGDPSTEDTSIDNGATWLSLGGTPGAFQVNANIPEPSSVALLIAGGLLLGFFSRKKRLGNA